MFFWLYGNFKIVLYIPFSNFPIVILSFFPYFNSSVSSALSLSLFPRHTYVHMRVGIGSALARLLIMLKKINERGKM